MLSAAAGPIAAAQRAAAATWGADASFLLVNGTTGGIHAAVMATCGPGDALVLARNAHLSAFNACVLAGCTPVYAQPAVDPQWGVAHQLAPAALDVALDAAAAGGRRVGAALVVSPTYFGVGSDVAGALWFGARLVGGGWLAGRVGWLARSLRLWRAQHLAQHWRLDETRRHGPHPPTPLPAFPVQPWPPCATRVTCP